VEIGSEQQGTIMPKRELLQFLIATSLMATGLAGSPAAGTEWKAGLAVAKITPEAPVAMAGYASRNKPSEGVVMDLYAKVLALEDTNGQRAVWVTTDLIGLRASVTEPLVERIIQRTGLKRHQVLINSSHTHTGPTIAESDSSAYSVRDEAFAATRAYRQLLQDRIVGAVEQALARMEPVELSHGTGVVPFVLNRREFTTTRGVILGVNPRGPADQSMPLLKVTSPDGKLRAVMFGAATHNTTLTGDEYRISGDYAGFAQDYVQKQLGGAQAMFMLGCAGDSNPYPRGTVEIARQHGETLGREVLRVLDTKLTPVRGPLNLQFDYADIPLAPVPSRSELEKMSGPGSPSWLSWGAGRMLQALDQGGKLPTHYRAPIAVWQFGADLTLVALSGEVVVDYVYLIEKAIGPQQVWIAAYSNDVFGYLPSARVLSEGGYETRGVSHGGIGYFSPGAQDVVVAKVRELAARAGRPGVGVRP
jgi:neutral ceramidase